MKKIIRIIAGGVILYLIFALYSFRPVTGTELASTEDKGSDDQLKICSVLSNGSIPDNSPTGVSDSLDVSFDLLISDLDIYLDITHTWVGDLIITIEHQGYGSPRRIIDRPGYPLAPFGCSGDDIQNYADDAIITQTFEDDCSNDPNPAYVAGDSYQPNEALNFFNGQTIKGTWVLTVSDNAQQDMGTLNEWCLRATLPGLQKSYAPVLERSVESWPFTSP